MKKTKIISTLGPSSFHVDVIARLIKAGVNVFRFNFSHGNHKQHLNTYHMVQKAERITGIPVGIDCDTKGAEIRTTANQNNQNFQYKQGQTFSIGMDSTGKVESTKDLVQSTYTGLFNDVKLGQHVLFDDGILDTICIKKNTNKHILEVKVQNDAVLGSRKTIDIPNSIVHLPGVTKKDANDIKFACENMNINYITASFLRSPKDVLVIRKILKATHMEDVQIFPKLENQQGIDQLKPIMKVADGVMVPRGDMAVNIPFENVPIVQNKMIQYCNQIGKPVIVATQMEASMAQNPRPSRAEVSDVANAVWDGTDATMLSGETAAGKWPVHAVTAMAKIDKKAEQYYKYYGKQRTVPNLNNPMERLVNRTLTTAYINNVKAITIYTKDGKLARVFSKFHPHVDVVALVPNERVQKGLMLNYAIQPKITHKKHSSSQEVLKLD